MGSRNGDLAEETRFKLSSKEMAFISEFTNEIYDQSNAAFQDQGDSTKVFLGVLVTLLPKILPRIMPALMSDPRIKEKFQDQEYLENVEHMFREKFIENLGIFENLILAWKNDNLNAEDFGLHPNHILAREDLIAGEPESFQYELLRGLSFLKDRMQRSMNGEMDAIERMANTIWNTANGIYQLVATYFNY